MSGGKKKTSRHFPKRLFFVALLSSVVASWFCAACSRCSQQLQGTESEKGTVCPDPGSVPGRESERQRLKGATEVGEGREPERVRSPQTNTQE